MVTDQDSRPIKYDTGFFQTESIQIGCPSNRYHYGVQGHTFLNTITLKTENPVAATLFDSDDIRSKLQVDTFTDEQTMESRSGVTIFTAKETGVPFKQGYAAAETGKNLSHLAADGTSADNRHAWWKIGKGEDGFVSKIPGFFQTRYEWGGGTGTGAYGSFFEAQCLAGDFNRVRSVETPLSDKHINPQVVPEAAG